MRSLHSVNVKIKNEDNTTIELCNNTKDSIRFIAKSNKKLIGDYQVLTYVKVADLKKALDILGYRLEQK